MTSANNADAIKIPNKVTNPAMYHCGLLHKRNPISVGFFWQSKHNCIFSKTSLIFPEHCIHLLIVLHVFHNWRTSLHCVSHIFIIVLHQNSFLFQIFLFSPPFGSRLFRYHSSPHSTEEHHHYTRIIHPFIYQSQWRTSKFFSIHHLWDDPNSIVNSTFYSSFYSERLDHWICFFGEKEPGWIIRTRCGRWRYVESLSWYCHWVFPIACLTLHVVCISTNLDSDKVPSPSPLDPLLAGLISIFIISTAVLSIVLFLKLRQHSGHPEFHRLQDLPMVSLHYNAFANYSIPVIC